MSEATGFAVRRQWLVIGGVFAVVVALLAGGYYLFLSGGYSVLADGVRPGEAAAIVAELDKRGTAYRLRDGGTTILVPDKEADATRLALVRSDATAAGQIGFELFNKSDMGLTNLAQKINYQRALQGELVRTITLMDGVESARVHLALPERALFRDDRTEPSAAVTVTMQAGIAAEPARVAGIQRLVAAAVPDLPAARVVVLDGEGRVISQEGGILDPVAQRPADAEARSAVEQYYHARARAAIEAARPALRYRLSALALPQSDGIVDPARWQPSKAGEARNFRLRLTLVTLDPLDADDQAALRSAVAPAVGLDETRGDVLLFETGPVEPAATALQAPDGSSMPARRTAASLPAAPLPVDRAGGWPGWWAWAALAVVGLLALVRWRRTRESALSGEEHDAFAQTLRRQLALTEGEHRAAR